MGDGWDFMITQNGKTRSYFGEDASKGERFMEPKIPGIGISP